MKFLSLQNIIGPAKLIRGHTIPEKKKYLQTWLDRRKISESFASH